MIQECMGVRPCAIMCSRTNCRDDDPRIVLEKRLKGQLERLLSCEIGGKKLEACPKRQLPSVDNKILIVEKKQTYSSFLGS
jgi:hypothetical protein